MCMHTAEQTPYGAEGSVAFRHAPEGGDTSLGFWDVDAVLKCPVVGMCLTLEEQRRTVKKAGLLSKKYGPFEIHEILVSCTNSDNTLARKADALLRKKYDREASLLRRLEPGLFMRHWKEAFAAGNFAAALWAAAGAVVGRRQAGGICPKSADVPSSAQSICPCTARSTIA